MAKAPAKKSKKAKPFGKGLKDVEIEPGAWERFTALIKNAAKMGHKPHKKESKSAKR
jgi:hypothetical protein